MIKRLITLLTLVLLSATCGFSYEKNGFQMEVLLNGTPLNEYYHRGTTYIEALKGKEYSIRLINPLPVRVAVALSVDGLNTIDARHTDAVSAKKWVLEPYESITISGWQTNSHHARKFYFTNEENSYGNALGKTQDLGIISAVFFKEKIQRRYSVHNYPAPPPPPCPEKGSMGSASSSSSESSSIANQRKESKRQAAETAEDYAATGIGRRINNDVQWIDMELESYPCAKANVRYEFHSILVKLGILPRNLDENATYRRNHARGFSDSQYCPEP